jgi:D-inositol-3-phosphate glycosyltransferase
MLSYHTSPLAALGGKHSGGMNVYVRELSAHLATLGHQVDVFTRGTAFAEEAIANGARLITLPAGPALPQTKHELQAHIPEFAQQVKSFAQRESLDYDLVHAHYWMSGLIGAELKRAWGVPMLLMFHTLGLVKNRITALGERESEERIRGERKAMAAADRVVAATPAERAELQWLYELRSDRVSVIPPGVDLGRFEPIHKHSARATLGLPLDQKLLLFVGRIEALKGIDTLIRACYWLRNTQDLEDMQVWIIGGDVEEGLDQAGSEIARLHTLTRELGMQDQVRFLGSRSQQQLPTYYSAADVVVMPSYSESFGMVALEAMACARPVVASRVGGLAYLVQDGVTGYHVQEGDSQELSGRLATLLEDDALLERMGQAARAEAEKYSWGRVAQEIDQLYLRMTKKE